MKPHLETLCKYHDRCQSFHLTDNDCVTRGGSCELYVEYFKKDTQELDRVIQNMRRKYR
jgi:hypothetical protein